MLKHYKLYAKIDKNDSEITEFVGTMQELAKYEGCKEKSIREYISHCKRNGKECPYICLGREEE